MDIEGRAIRWLTSSAARVAVPGADPLAAQEVYSGATRCVDFGKPPSPERISIAAAQCMAMTWAEAVFDMDDRALWLVSASPSVSVGEPVELPPDDAYGDEPIVAVNIGVRISCAVAPVSAAA